MLGQRKVWFAKLDDFGKFSYHGEGLVPIGLNHLVQEQQEAGLTVNVLVFVFVGPFYIELNSFIVSIPFFGVKGLIMESKLSKV